MKKYIGKLIITKFSDGIIECDKFKKKIRVNKNNLNGNITNDSIKFIILKENERIIYAKIISKPKFDNRDFVGIVYNKIGNCYLIYCNLFGKSNLIKCKYKIKLNNNFVKFKIIRVENNNYYGKIIENIGSIEDNNAVTKYLIFNNNLNEEFPQKVLQKAKKIEKRYYQNYKKELKNRKDITHFNTFTIDPKGARDLDDAITVFDFNSLYKVLIHIADVSYFVKEGTSIDKEALKRSFSVYLPSKVIRMLPSILSENLCSLLPNKAKYAVTTDIDIDKKGNIIKYEIYKSVIKSCCKFTYEEVYDIIANKKKHFLEKELKILYDISKIISKNKLTLPEKKFDNKQLILEYQDFSHSMISELMILNNQLVAKYLKNKNYR